MIRSRRRNVRGDGVHGEAPAWTLTVPDAHRALRTGSDDGGPLRAAQGAERAGGRVLCAFAAVVFAALALAATVPLTRTVELSGRLVPERVIPVRTLYRGLVAEVLVAAGDTVTAGALLARLDGRALHAEREALGRASRLPPNGRRLPVRPWHRSPEGGRARRPRRGPRRRRPGRGRRREGSLRRHRGVACKLARSHGSRRRHRRPPP